MKALTLGMVCQVEGGKKRLVFPLLAQNRYAAMLAKLGDGELVQVVFSQKRDTKHNSKIHGVCAEVADALCWETDEFKEFIVTKLRPLDECPITGHVRRQKTSQMSDEEIDALVMEIKAWTFHHMPGFEFAFDLEHLGVETRRGARSSRAGDAHDQGECSPDRREGRSLVGNEPTAASGR